MSSLAGVGDQILGKRICDQRGWDFAEVFKYHFAISRQSRQLCKEWTHKSFGSWHLEHCPALRCSEIVSSKGAKLGVVLGVAVDRNGQLLSGNVVLDQADTIEALQHYIEGLAGRYIVIVHGFGVERIYFDPSGGLSAVYAPKSNAVSSCTHLILDREIEPNTDISSDDVLSRKQQFLLGETCDRHCKRAWANHFLDLERMELVRHWPREDDKFELETDVSQTVAEIGERLHQIMTALIDAFHVALPLSGGTDSRILLSACRGQLNKIEHYYIHDHKWVTEFDRLSAQKLARKLGLPLQVFHRDAPDWNNLDKQALNEVRDQMALQTSLSFNGIDDQTTRAVEHAPACDLTLRGNMAEMTRANKWEQDLLDAEIGALEGLEALSGKTSDYMETMWADGRYEKMLARYQSWIDTLPKPARNRIPDIAHVEVFGPAGPNNVYYAFKKSFYINPFNDRRLFYLTATISPGTRKRRKQVARDIIRFGMPEIDGMPFAGYFRKLFRSAKEQGFNLLGEF